jgi:hypothetical protein
MIPTGSPDFILLGKSRLEIELGESLLKVRLQCLNPVAGIENQCLYLNQRIHGLTDLGSPLIAHVYM